ncbi:FAD/NAD(P)-binding domain-containing protein [Multifurca ochricompacta]|uniref:FAD/NAD(P)-binding domain-containing protein n=1 Tax=Multifurca ochricompacta TaxID=376703 RepID=A0AAD4QML3_9AGAM|nr:FAD/NAD(P)-binding domain-containing protein [Multifurca ochricompacta]
MAEHPSGVSRRVCVIGAGANGLATLKVLADTHQVQSGQWTLVAFEERDNIGGIWYPAPPSGNPPLTPLYDSLSANIPHPIMAYQSFPFPPETSLFPTASIVQKYLEDYATHFKLLRYVRLCTRVETAFWDTDSKEWEVTLSTGERQVFDFVVVANGHYRKPRYPVVAGLQSWLDAGRAIHSVWYRCPHDYAHHKKIVVVGGGPSAIDVCGDMKGVIPLILHSIPGPTYAGGPVYPDDSSNYRKVDRIKEYQEEGAILLADGSIESDIDLVILATGYELSFPFLPQIKLGVPSLPPPLPDELYNSTYHIFPLAHHLFPLKGDFPPTSIAFTGLQYRVAPFPLFEDQARAIARVLEEPECLDTLSCATDVVARVHSLMREKGTQDPLLISKAWLRFGLLEPFEYRAKLNEFAGKNWTATDWELELWERKRTIRREWKDIEESGKTEEWLKGVGLNGILICKELIKRAIIT